MCQRNPPRKQGPFGYSALKWKVRIPDQVYEDVSTIRSCCAARLIVAALYDHNVTGRELS